MLPSLFLFSIFLFFLAALQVRAAKKHWLQPCNPGHQKLQEGSFQFQTECDAMTYCAANRTCVRRGCRRDEYPFGYPRNVTMPPKCGQGFFCPDEQDQCQKVLAVGSACQFNRDDECDGPPNFKELADTAGFGHNYNGSVCLHNRCMWANVTVGLPCIVQNTAYTGYRRAGEFIHVVSRGNCKVGLYCDTRQGVCMQTKGAGQPCDADKECSTFNCAADRRCGPAPGTLRKISSWVYAVVGVYIVGGMVGTPIALYFVDKKHRRVEREKRLEYWREQNALRQDVPQMQETVQHLLVGCMPGGGSPASEDSGTPTMKGSGLRFYVSEDASQIDDRSDEDMKA